MKRRFNALCLATLLGSLAAPLALWGAPTQPYVHGDPTGAEQYVLELINRARANPTAEGVFVTTQTDLKITQAYQYFQTHLPPFLDLNAVRVAFTNYTAQPPLAFNSSLISAARFAANDQATHNYQGHVSSDGSTIVTRATSAGYTNYSGLAENTYTTVTSPLFGHVGFNVDWGVSTLGHRINIMNLNLPIVFKEVGIAYVAVANTSFGNAFPNVLTEDFGITFLDANTPYLVGVCYRDTNGDNFYNDGEGRSGITVTPDVGTFFAVTSTSGGYAIPLKNLPPGITTVNVTFSGGGLAAPITRQVTLNGIANKKLDLQVTDVQSARLINLATRLRVEIGDNVGIAGFVITGTGSKKVAIRSLGPSLAAQGVSGVLTDPTLALFGAAGQIATNNNWRDTQQAAIQATGLAPTDDRESVILATLQPGAYTAIVAGNAGAVGVALVEVYDLDPASPLPTANAVNVATRGQVQTGDNVMIGGFVISGNRAKKVVIRARGPSLASQGVTGVLQDPVLDLIGGSGLIATNDNWRSTQQAELMASGLAPSDDREAAIITTLQPGAYTAIVRGAGGTTGVGLVEVYDQD